MRTAVLDLGTNTFDLIIVEHDQARGRFKVLYTDKSFVHLGERGSTMNQITLAAKKRAFFALEHFLQACFDYHVNIEHIRAFGTSALRDAENRAEIKAELKQKLGIDIMIIRGDQEAQWVYEGIKGIHPFQQKSCIMDIGGGSTEFIFADQQGVSYKESLDIGVSRILQLFDSPGKLNKEKQEQMIQFMEQASPQVFESRQTRVLIGAAGSFETYYQLITKSASYDTFKTHELPINALKHTLNQLIASSFEERCDNFWIPNYRRKMIHIAALQTKWVLERLDIKQCYFSPAALKEGVLFAQK